MTITEVSTHEYAERMERHPHVFNTPAFAALNAHKADAVRYLLFGDNGKTRFGLILGERGGKLLSPFSAPFGGFSVNRGQSLGKIDEAVVSLAEYAKKERKNIRITLPPQIFAHNLTASCINALSRHARLLHVDLDYYFPMSKFAGYTDALDRNARNKLRQAEKNEFEFIAVERGDLDGLRRAYGVIRRNRAEHGYPLRMSLDDVEATVNIVPADFFILRHGGEDVAAAQIFHVAEGIAQVIYWGDLHAYSHLRTMNYLAYRIFEFYSHECLRVLDIGPSTEDGEPNYGLCEFKTGIGCDVTPKFVFEI